MIIAKIDTTPSLFDPLEIDVNGQLFRCRTVTLAAIERIQSLEADARSGSAAAIRQMLETLIDGDITPIVNLELPTIQRLMTTIIERITKPTEPEKNAPRPADDQSH